MEKGICTYTLIPMRKEPAESSEMVSQIIFGETYSILETAGKWAKIETDFDKYFGWIDSKLLSALTIEEYNDIKSSPVKIIDKILCTAKVSGNEGLFYILAGSEIHQINNQSFTLLSKQYEMSYPLNANSIVNVGEKAASQALQMLNIPYLWGGRTTFGVDCSGLVQTAYKIAGINLLRDASQQVLQGQVVSFLHEAKTGDVAFFDNDEGRIVHVGILLSPDKIVHASGSVRIDTIDHQGIFNTEKDTYTHKLRIIKRMAG